MTAAELHDIVKPLKTEDWPAGLEYDPPTPLTPVPHRYYSWWMKSLNDGPVDSRGGWNARYQITTDHAAAIFGWWLCVKHGLGVVFTDANQTWAAYHYSKSIVEFGFDLPLKDIVAAVVSTYAKDHP